ncbi:MAG TPA: glycerophosphodiester phosphodiesterase [Acidimicrobiales bacterium]|nr:glycerophosphodiester phosphodiesterase [Acidimicrobiales bacterium]
MASGGWEYFDSPGPLAIAHRGGAAEAPENSWAAFERAVGLGFTHMETDVRLSRDGVVVVMHDPTVERATGRPGRVSEMTWAQLQRLRLADGRPVPRLEEVLEAWPDVRWNIDVKHEAAIGPVVDLLRDHGRGRRTLVASFSTRRTAKVRSGLGPEVATGAGRVEVALLLAARWLPFVRPEPRASAVQVPVKRKGVPIVDRRFVGTCHHAGVAVHVWTINQAAEMTRLLDLGVDGIMTDRPSLLKEVLCRRGEWFGGA